MEELKLSPTALKLLNTRTGLLTLMNDPEIDPMKAVRAAKYEQTLKKLQAELIRMHKWIEEKEERLVVIFEGRDAAGKGGAIRRISEHLNPRSMRTVALPKPSVEEIGQWYFQRYIQQLPNRGEIVFFDRSWYNRAVVEPVNGFCSDEQYERFMREVVSFEQMLSEDGIMLIKFYFSITKEEQLRRFEAIKNDPLKRWKMTPVDEKAQELWNEYTRYKKEMFRRTNTAANPWVVIQANNKNKARLKSIRYILSTVPYKPVKTD
jgi:polyphosphate kinase 2